MSDVAVRIVEIEPMRVGSVRVMGESPEQEAWETLRAWAAPKGLLDDLQQHPVFGFNNPGPSKDRKEYGYEFWIRVGPNAKTEGKIEVKDFPGGLYAVTTCRLQGDPVGTVMEVWRTLWDWVQRSPHPWRKTHEIEKPHDPRAPLEAMVLDLYLPIEQAEARR
jgi:DNA gyrase inhibitor GyrI